MRRRPETGKESTPPVENDPRQAAVVLSRMGLPTTGQAAIAMAIVYLADTIREAEGLNPVKSAGGSDEAT